MSLVMIRHLALLALSRCTAFVAYQHQMKIKLLNSEWMTEMMNKQSCCCKRYPRESKVYLRSRIKPTFAQMNFKTALANMVNKFSLLLEMMKFI